MPSTPRPHKAILYVEVDPALADQFRAFAGERGTTLSRELQEAMRRHLAYPPPPLPPPGCAPLGDAQPARTRKRAARKS